MMNSCLLALNRDLMHYALIVRAWSAIVCSGYTSKENKFFTDKLKILDIAPTKGLSEKIKALPNINYMSIDMNSNLAMRHMDITAMDFPDNTFDCVTCYHVLEHIPDDRKAMREILRVMKPGGWAILQCL